MPNPSQDYPPVDTPAAVQGHGRRGSRKPEATAAATAFTAGTVYNIGTDANSSTWDPNSSKLGFQVSHATGCLGQLERARYPARMTPEIRQNANAEGGNYEETTE